MELPIKVPETRYRIKTISLSYSISRGVSEFKWVFCKQVNTKISILKNVNCEAKPGGITAIAGPSGAGKTTLIDILAGMIPLSGISGHVLVNELPMNAKYFRRVSGYVTQEEALFPHLTVEETLMFSARLRLFGGMEKAKARVTELLKELGLELVKNERVGNEWNRGISGGEKRRVSIGVNLVHEPSVLLLDEPTSGLDSASALHAALLLKSMATNRGKTIILTIHQPGFRILELFDQIILLAKGAVIHSGSLELLEQRLQLSQTMIPRHVNVVEFAIEVADALTADMEDSEIENGITEQDNKQHLTKSSNIPSAFCPTSPVKEVLILSQRFCINIFRTKQLFITRTIQAVLVGLLLGTLFTSPANESESARLQKQLGFFAFSLTFLMSSSTEGLAIYLQERRILMRETSRGAYKVSSHIISDTLIFLPFLLTVSLLYTIPVYWLVGLKRGIDGFLYFSLVAWMVVLMSNSLIAFASAVVPDFIMGTSLVSTLFGSSFLFSGYFIPKENIPKYWIFMHYLSLFKYPLECFMMNEYGGDEGKRRCLARENGVCVLDGGTFLMQRGLKESQKWSHLLVMLSFILGYKFLCFLILKYRSLRTKN